MFSHGPAEQIMVCRLNGPHSAPAFSFAPRDAVPEGHFPCAAYVLFTKQAELGSLSVLMLNHKSTSASWPGSGDLPGGGVSPPDCNDNHPNFRAFEVAAWRECLEETNLDVNSCTHFRDAISVMFSPDQHGTKAYTMVLMVPADLNMPAPTHLESKFESAGWLPIDDAIARVALAAATPGVKQKDDIAIVLRQAKALLVR